MLESEIVPTSQNLDIIQNLEKQLREATLRNDVAIHNQLLADSWLNTNVNGTTTHKAQLLALLQSHPFAFLAIEDDDLLIRVYENVAIVTGRSTRRRSAADSSVITQQVRFTRVYVKIENRWQVVSGQATPLLG